MPAVAEASLSSSPPRSVSLESPQKVRPASAKEDAAAPPEQPAASSTAGASAGWAATAAAGALAGTAAASASVLTAKIPVREHGRTLAVPDQRSFTGSASRVRSRSNSQPELPPPTLARHPYLTAVPATAPPQFVVRVAQKSECQPPLPNRYASSPASNDGAIYTPRFVPNFFNSYRRAVPRREDLNSARREAPNFANRDGPGFNPAPRRRRNINVQQSQGDRHTSERQPRRIIPKNQTNQIRPVLNHQVLMEISSRWLAADARAKADAKAKAELKAKTKAKAKAGAKAKAEAKDNVDADTETEAKDKAEAKAKADANAKVGDEADPKSQVDSKVTAWKTGVRQPPPRSGGGNIAVEATLGRPSNKLSTVSGDSEQKKIEVRSGAAAARTIRTVSSAESDIGGQTAAVVKDEYGSMSFAVETPMSEEVKQRVIATVKREIKAFEESSGGDKKITFVISGQNEEQCENFASDRDKRSANEGDCKVPNANEKAETERKFDDQVDTRVSIESCCEGSATGSCKPEQEPTIPTPTPDGSLTSRVRNENELENGGLESVTTCENRQISIQTRRRRKQQLHVRGTDPIPSPSKTAVAPVPSVSSSPVPNYRSTAKTASRRPPQQRQRQFPRYGTTSREIKRSSINATTASSKHKQLDRYKGGRFCELAPKDSLPQRCSRSSEEAADAVAMQPPASGGVSPFDQLLMTSTYAHLPPTQAPEQAAVRSRTTTLGSRSMGELWSAWGGAVDAPPRRPGVESVRQPPAASLAKENEAPVVPSQVTRVRLKTSRGNRAAKRTSKKVEKRCSWKPRACLSGEDIDTNEETKDPSENDDDIDGTAPENQVVELVEDISPTKAAEELWQALDNLDTDTEIDNLTPPPRAGSSSSILPITSNFDDIELEDLLSSPLMSRGDTLASPQPLSRLSPTSPSPSSPSPPSRSPPIISPERLTISATLPLSTQEPPESSETKSMVTPARLSPPSKTQGPVKEPVRQLSADPTRASTVEPAQTSTLAPLKPSTMTSVSTTPTTPKTALTPAPSSASWSTPTTRRTNYTQMPTMPTSTPKMSSPPTTPDPLTSPQKQTSFPYQCLFCGVRFGIAGQHMNHLQSQCQAPLTGLSWVSEALC